MRNETERKLAKKWKNEGMSYSEISRRLSISRDSAASLCKYKKKSFKCKTGPKEKMSFKDKFNIKRRISLLNNEQKKVNSSVLKSECNLTVSNRTIRRYLGKLDMKYKKAGIEIYLSKKDKQVRKEIISHWISSDVKWENVIFSDEKCFSLDGPYDWRSFVRSNEKILRQRRQCRGGSIMVWLFCMSNGLLGYRIVKSTLNSTEYIQFLKKSLIPAIKLNFNNGCIFQDDNAKIHRAKIVKDFIEQNKIEVIQWPPRSPDINIVENIWKLLSDMIYNGSQFNNKKDLLKKIEDTINFFNNSNRDKIIDLYKTFRQRLATVLVSNGNLLNTCK